MSKTPSLRLRLPLLDTGDEPNAWGVTLRGLFGLVDDSQGAVTVAVNGNVTLTNDNYVTNQARYAGLRTTGTGLAGNAPALVTIPAVDKWRIVKNDCQGDIKVGTGAGLAATVRAGTMAVVLCDGTDTFVIDPTLDKIARPVVDVQMGGFTFTGLRAGTAPSDAARLDQTGPFNVSLAKDWATKLDGEVVVGQGYSARYYAQMAATFDPSNYYTKPQTDALVSSGRIVGLSYGPDALA